jgi:gamma-glutamyltranspeptidase/glutathione hydrolase
MAVVITPIGRDFGSGVLIPELSGFGNSGMGNFDPRPGRANSIAPGKRPLFGVPTAIAVDDAGRAVAGCGGSGGWAITSSVTHALVNVLVHGLDAADAVALPRMWCEGGATYADDRLPTAVLDGLRERGHPLQPRALTPASEPFARCSLVLADASGAVSAASDPRWHGAAEVRS